MITAPALAVSGELPTAAGLTLSDPRDAPLTARYAGTSAERQSVGLPGHCEACAQHGHVLAHPDFGCADAGCADSH